MPKLHRDLEGSLHKIPGAVRQSPMPERAGGGGGDGILPIGALDYRISFEKKFK